MTIGMKLETYLANNGLTHEAFGKKINRSQAAIWRYVNGKRFPDKDTIIAISEATNRQVDIQDWYEQEGAE